MILYTNGDSFVAGNGLIMPDFPGFPGMCELGGWSDPTFPEKTSRWFFESLVKQNLISDHIRPIERTRAFPYKLSKQLNVQLVDNSEGGSSFHRITRTSLSDLLRLKQEHQDTPIVAIIGMTAPARSEVPYIHPSGTIPSWIEVHFGSRDANPKHVDSIMYYKLKFETLYHQMTAMFQNIILLREFCLNNKIKLYFTGSEWSELEQVPYRNHPDLLLLKNYVGKIYDVSMTAAAKKIKTPLLPDGHFNEEVHDLVTKRFVEMIKKL